MLLYFQLVLVAFNQRILRPISRGCRRLTRLQGWCHMVWNGFDDKGFKANFRVTEATFLYIVGNVRFAIVHFDLAHISESSHLFWKRKLLAPFVMDMHT